MVTDSLSWEEQARLLGRATRLRWLINLRWAGLVGILLTGAATQVTGYTVLLNLGWLAAPLALIYNLVFLVWLRYVERRYERGAWPAARAGRALWVQAYLQAFCDVVALYVVIYLNGGVACPILYIPLVAVMFSSIVLPAWGVFLQANLV